ncbi:MAG: hypothetical protein PHH01_03285 [Patescibacteria group bacterium]|nr:hypothetical protein [Patescibacteria group bacterium]
MGSPLSPAGIQGRLGNVLNRSVDDFDSRRTIGGLRGQSAAGMKDDITSPAEQRAASRRMGSAKAQAAQAAVQAIAEGEGKGQVAEAAAAAALEAKKIQQFRLILLAIRGGSAITVVGIIITILIWGIQLIVGHIMGHEKWKMSKWELPFAIIIWVLVFFAVVAQFSIWALYLKIIQ